ncbi:YjfB family protein [Aureibacillus halotolerans]|uniref:Putative motility protein YjfB-like n=1 Tax=Aureibacillus halotolerans TaxID=1508390 RepID=A0A4R6UCX3_9BACI|nr:YjfB family protein [Aureibacillus halotolerans]TDQ42899.1 putative motility protein YjfB-like [Aureibacillus halotolerans]
MDIAAVSIAMNQGQLKQQVSLAVMKMAMGTGSQQSSALSELMNSADISAMQRAAQPNLGGNIDLKG